MLKLKYTLPLLLLIVLSAGCKKDPVLFEDNDPPFYEGIPDVVIENYVNRIFIDLIGREPFDQEMINEVNNLKSEGLSFEAREILLVKLQSDTNFIARDISYKHAYYQRIYDQSKARFMEAVSDQEIGLQIGIIQGAVTIDSINAIWDEVEYGRGEIANLNAVLASNSEYRDGLIEMDDMSSFMINNRVYDDINMNTFNFINASFDNLFFRFPTDAEFFNGFDMVENNIPHVILGESGQNKLDYIEILTSSREFYQGLVIWVYQVLLARDATTLELSSHLNQIYLTHDLQTLQREVMKTDEYAQFD